MKRAGALALLMLAASPALGQTSPTPGFEDPRLQTVTPVPGVPVRLVAFPNAPLTMIFSPGEQIERVTVSETGAFDVTVVGHNDAVAIAPRRPDARANLSVVTNRQIYPLEVETGTGLAAAYVVRVVEVPTPPVPQPGVMPNPHPTGVTGNYRVRGSRALRPSEISDDGHKTYIRWGAHQALPAVFGVGASGEEEVVNGHMRGDLFTIDRVYTSLVFRIDREKAEARRREERPSR